jgi:hypothetical protein
MDRQKIKITAAQYSESGDMPQDRMKAMSLLVMIDLVDAIEEINRNSREALDFSRGLVDKQTETLNEGGRELIVNAVKEKPTAKSDGHTLKKTKTTTKKKQTLQIPEGEQSIEIMLEQNFTKVPEALEEEKPKYAGTDRATL